MTGAAQPLRRALLAAAVGAGAGVMVAGFGERLAMRLVAAVTPTAAGRLTEAGDTIGTVTLDGTLDVLKMAAVVGAAGGLAYLAVRPALPDRAWWRGLGFGLVAAALAMLPTVEGNRGDFRILPLALSALAFAVPIFINGVVTAVAIDRVLGRPDRRYPQRWRVALMVVSGLAIAVNVAIFLFTS
jgi:hypothetical protein